MDNEPYRCLTHKQLVDCGEGWLLRCGCKTYREVELPDGRRADLIGVMQDGTIIVIEAKDYMDDSLVQATFDKYGTWADHLFVITETPAALLSASKGFGQAWSRSHDRVGLISASIDGMKERRSADALPLSSTRRGQVLESCLLRQRHGETEQSGPLSGA
jgi:hypothetical protein